MRNLLVLLLLIGMGYFAYQAFVSSPGATGESATQRAIRENNLEDIEDEIPGSTQDAFIETKNETDQFIVKIENTIKQWRKDIKQYIDEKI